MIVMVAYLPGLYIAQRVHHVLSVTVWNLFSILSILDGIDGNRHCSLQVHH
jgi:hypothetical protein